MRKLQRAGRTVVMIGDGVNDSRPGPGGRRIAMGVAGTDIAIEAAHIVVMRENWRLVPEVFTVAQRTMRVVKLNSGFTIAYNLVSSFATAASTFATRRSGNRRMTTRGVEKAARESAEAAIESKGETTRLGRDLLDLLVWSPVQVLTDDGVDFMASLDDFNRGSAQSHSLRTGGLAIYQPGSTRSCGWGVLMELNLQGDLVRNWGIRSWPFSELLAKLDGPAIVGTAGGSETASGATTLNS